MKTLFFSAGYWQSSTDIIFISLDRRNRLAELDTVSAMSVLVLLYMNTKHAINNSLHL